MPRDSLVDRLKGYACLLVVFGHVILGLRNAGIPIPAPMPGVEAFVWTFHVPLFLFLSGYVYRLTGGWKSKGSRRRFLGKKLLDLGIPYFVFSAVYILFNCITPGVNTQSSLSDILWLWKTPVAQYWFLYALLWLFVLWALLSDRLKAWQITLLALALLYAARLLRLDLGFFGTVLICAFAFGLGTSLPALQADRLPIPLKLGLILLHLVPVGIFVAFGIEDCYGIDELCQALGIFASIAFVSLLTLWRPAGAFLDFICKYSFPLYLLHTFATAAVRILLLKCGLDNYLLHVIVGMAAGIALPVAAAKIASYVPALNFFFYPSRVLNRKK